METALEIQPFFHTATGTWSYVVSRGGDAVVIDPVLDYDPKSGRSYKARLTSNPDGTLTVTGCLLFICQSQSWRRAP